MELLRPVDLSPGFDLPSVLGQVRSVLDGTSRPLAPSADARPLPVADEDQELLSTAAVVLTTSGSSGDPKRVVLDRSALLASAAGTHERLGGPGQWLLALAPQHVAGFQVLVRSVVAGTDPVVLDQAGGFTTSGFAAAVAAMRPSGRRYASLVPTQLTRLLAEPSGLAALERLDAVLVGGAALPRATRERLASTEVRASTTYGMTETAGGCCYDGHPLDGVQVRVGEAGRLSVGGPTLARGYLGRPDLTARRFSTDPSGIRWFRTDDVGRHTVDGVTVLGRLDDVINTGGVKVGPGEVTEALLTLPWITGAYVVGVPDPDWGERVAAAVVLSADATVTDSADLVPLVRDALRRALPAPALPRQVIALDRLPVLATGKPDRLALRALLAGNGGRMGGRPDLT